MKNRFLILLSFVLIVGRDVVCANTSMVRERININRDWRYQIDDPDGVGAALKGLSILTITVRLESYLIGGYAGIVKHWSYRRMMPGNKFILILMGRCHTFPCGVTGNMWVDGLMAMLLFVLI